MQSPTILATQIITPEQGHGGSFTAAVICFAVAAVCLVAALLGIAFWDLEPPFVVVLAMGTVAGPLLGGASLADATKGPQVNVAAAVNLIEENYDLTAVKATGNDAPSAERLCQPVSLDSPEFAGIADGQKVTFRMGVPDCDSPDPEIVITETTGHAIDLDELRRKQ